MDTDKMLKDVSEKVHESVIALNSAFKALSDAFEQTSMSLLKIMDAAQKRETNNWRKMHGIPMGRRIRV